MLALVALAVLAGVPDAGRELKIEPVDVVLVNLGLESLIDLDVQIPGEGSTEVFKQERVATHGKKPKAKAFSCRAGESFDWVITILSLGESTTIRWTEQCQPEKLFQMEWGMDLATAKMTAGVAWEPKPRPKKR